MNRRELLTLLGGGAIWPLTAGAQQKAMSVVGFLHSASSGQVDDLLAAFRSGLKEAGFSEGHNVAIKYRWAENDSERLPALAADLVSQKVDILAAGGGDRSARAAKQATSKVPIVAVIGGDPVAQGLVAGLARPGGNLTGVSFLTTNLTAKRLELLLELTPKTRVIAFLANSMNPQSSEVADDLKKVAIAKGLELHVVTASTDAEVERAFATMDRLRVGAVVIQADPYFNNVRGQLISLAARYSLPAIQERSVFVAEGGLISYGTSLPAVYRQVGIYCGKILKGASPSDLPVLQPTKFELAVNLKTAKSLGITIPPAVVALADEVIE
jgi:putative tryptophan/tyrosine transport system substrate-binding protein